MYFGIEEAELQRLMDTYVIEEGGSASLENIKKAIASTVQKNNEAIREQIETMVAEEVKKQLNEQQSS